MTKKKLPKSYIKANKVTFFATKMLPKNFSHKTPRYGCLWTCLDPSNYFKVDWDPGAKFWVQGSFGPKYKKLQFSHKTLKYGCLLSMDSP